MPMPLLHGAGEAQVVVVEHCPFGIHADSSLLGELERVADQVDQNLPNPGRIADYRQRFQPWLNMQLE